MSATSFQSNIFWGVALIPRTILFWLLVIQFGLWLPGNGPWLFDLFSFKSQLKVSNQLNLVNLEKKNVFVLEKRNLSLFIMSELVGVLEKTAVPQELQNAQKYLENAAQTNLPLFLKELSKGNLFDFIAIQAISVFCVTWPDAYPPLTFI